MMKLFGKVAELWRYPVSSMGGERLDKADVRAGGFNGDRLWGVIDKVSGEVAGPEKRRHWRPLPNLASRLGSSGSPEIGDGQGNWLSVENAEAAELVSAHLGLSVELRRHSLFEQHVEGHVAPRYGRADIHILTTASMRTLAGLLNDPAEVDTRRFRPNILIETEDEFEGFAEHEMIGKTLRIGEVLLSITEPCARCAFTSIAQGELAFEPAVLHKIAQHGKGGFGAYCTVAGGGMISVGDQIVIEDT